jgi:hypothetical protein
MFDLAGALEPLAERESGRKSRAIKFLPRQKKFAMLFPYGQMALPPQEMGKPSSGPGRGGEDFQFKIRGEEELWVLSKEL